MSWQAFYACLKRAGWKGWEKAKRIYTGEYQAITLANLAIVCQALDATPPGIFCWHGSTLVWRVADLGRQMVPDMPDIDRKNRLAQLAGIYGARKFDPDLAEMSGVVPQPMDRIWMGWSPNVYIQTMGGLCLVLNQNLGDLFSWTDAADDVKQQYAHLLHEEQREHEAAQRAAGRALDARAAAQHATRQLCADIERLRARMGWTARKEGGDDVEGE